MATLKFKDPSPYVKGPQGAPPVDYLYARYLENIKMTSKEGNSQGKIQMALFGAGRAGSIHLSSMTQNPRVTVRYVVDDDQSKWIAIKSYWHLDNSEFLLSKDSNRVFQDAGVQAVVVASPTVCHEETIRGALLSGKHIFCEKPVAQDSESAERCYQLAARCGKTLFCAFNRRFDPAYSLLKERVRQGEVGHVQTIKVCSRDSPLPTIAYLRTSGGIFHDCAVHDIDIMCWVLGEYPHRVTAHEYAHTPEIAAIGDHDTVAVVLSFPSGTLGMIDLSRNSTYGYDQRLEVFGPRGMLTCNNERPMCGMESHIGLRGRLAEPIYFSFSSRYQLAYVNEMEHFLDVIQGKDMLKVLGHETLAVSKIASACEESARLGQSVELTWKAEDLPPK
ncbi:putative oxidoreductase YrbE [Cryptotermes secundus]|uniref:Putative oxidoreductase YrbE n=3 Tax=Cryptotermes secundus TaxID=105785 RepID=A0A2J7QKP2_9NEOP|nr:putative oxidoreductase YrbE [Cryptotermes secundus]